MAMDEKRLEKVKFFNPAGARGRRIKFEAQNKWRGDHSQCAPGHHDKECVSAGGWILHGGTHKVMPHLIPVSIEEGAMSTVEYPGQKGRYPESIHQSKGMRDAAEAEGVRPTPEVLEHVISRASRAQKASLEHRGAKFEEVEKRIAELRTKILDANAAPTSPKYEQKAARNG